MIDTRRRFIQQAAMLTGASASGLLSESIQKAAAIEPLQGSSYLDAKHIVVLMQENRSFDHVYGELRGVRGFGDPRAIRLPDGSPVWAQADSEGNRYLPFRLNLRETNATWMGSLPHSWTDQVDARNEGRYDRWLVAKRSGNKDYARMPLTMGYYSREDLPFYYDLADAFTVCDQNFCSCLTGTTPNRLHLWTGTIRAQQNARSPANVLNSDVDYGRWASWATFPERLEQLGVSWKVYQNELSLKSGLSGEQEAWLANFTDNPLEWFQQYAVQYAASHQRYIGEQLTIEIPAQIRAKQEELSSATGKEQRRLKREIDDLQKLARRYEVALETYTPEKFATLPEFSQQLHHRAFTTNVLDADYRELTDLNYQAGGQQRSLQVPKSDSLYQFRQDVQSGQLPTISWLVPSERYSDHPGSAWFGAWYLSETLDILTKNPEVWKKTVFILTYDENDGYFDHVPPYVAPDPRRPETGRVSSGIDASLEFVTLEQDRKWHPFQARESSIGLGYRVPMVIASPWSRGGAVCSQVFDHTSVLQFMEKVLSHQTGQTIREPNINRWRRAVCGDLTAAFKSPKDISSPLSPVDHEVFASEIHQAKFKQPPSGFRALSDDELLQLSKDPKLIPSMPKQEPGLRPACPLPYELGVWGTINAARDSLNVRLQARKDYFKDQAAGAAFTAYVFTQGNQFQVRNYAVEPGESIEDHWRLEDFSDGTYRLHIHGPNGYFWVLSGSRFDPQLEVSMLPLGGKVEQEVHLRLLNQSPQESHEASIRDNAYGNADQTIDIASGSAANAFVSTASSHRWYDVSVRVNSVEHFERRFAGRIENGQWSFSDPKIGC